MLGMYVVSGDRVVMMSLNREQPGISFMGGIRARMNDRLFVFVLDPAAVALYDQPHLHFGISIFIKLDQ